MPKRKRKPIHVEVDVRNGGALMTRPSSDEAGLFNYEAKEEWRRDLDKEVRREGHDYFWPNTTTPFDTDPLDQPFPNNATLKESDATTTVHLDTLTYSGGIATITFLGQEYNDFIAGEMITVASADESEYNGDFVILATTKLTITYAVSGTPSTPDSGKFTVKSNEPVNLIHTARRANGQIAVIAGTKTRLFRFIAMEATSYFEDDGTGDQYYENGGSSTLEYFKSNASEWAVIASQLSPEGKRWQAVNLNGYAIFNNEVDLPLTYRVEELVATPIYQLREQGIASVGGIVEAFGLLKCYDISEIKTTSLDTLFREQSDYYSDALTARQQTSQIIINRGEGTNSYFTTVGHINKWIIWDTYSGETAPADSQITALSGVSNVKATVSSAELVTSRKFTIRNKSKQIGKTWSAPITGQIAAPAYGTVSASGAIFVAGDVGKTIIFANGFESVIQTQASTTATISPVAPENVESVPFWIVDKTVGTDYEVVAQSQCFTAEMVGTYLVWDDGSTRKITAYTGTTTVEVDSFYPITEGYFSIENEDTYKSFTDTENINRIQYRTIWSNTEDPRDFASSYLGTITQGSNVLSLRFPIKSVEASQVITIIGAGDLGSNLSVTVLRSAAGKILTIDAFASSQATLTGVQQTASIGSIVGQFDIQDDASAIMGMAMLRGVLVIYKDTAIILVSYTGATETPFAYKILRIPLGQSLYFKHTLLGLNTESHLYAGKNAFYTFDLTSQKPKVFPVLQLADSTFFDEASIDNTDSVFAAHNAPTQEIWFSFPSSGEDKIIAYDYRFGTVSTIQREIGAANTIVKPDDDRIIGAGQDWFVFSKGESVLLYGKTTENVSSWSDNKIHYTRDVMPYSATKGDYTSTLRSGMADFGDAFDEKFFNSYTLLLSSDSSSTETVVNFYGARNIADTSTFLFSKTLTTPEYTHTIPTHALQHYFQDEIIVTGSDNPMEIRKRIWEVGKVDSNSKTRS